MESLVGQHNKKFPVFVTTKVDNENEEECSSYVETTESNLYIKSEEVDVKLEINYESIKSTQEEYLASKIEEDFHAIDNLKQEGIDIDENQLDLKNEADFEAEKAALPSIAVAVLSLNSEGGHTLVQKNTLQNTTSPFQTHPHISKYPPRQGKRKSAKKKQCHKVLLKCEQCSFEAQYISKLNVHIRVHKNPSELDMYECTHCDFKTKYQGSLKSHSSLHKNSGDMSRYKCNFCDFETKHRGSFANHSILHKDAVDIPRYKCNSCHFESKRKNALKRHIRLHQNTSGNVLKCEQCFYECSHPSLLRSHMRVHKDPLDIYECTQCNFKTKHSSSLTRHSILHKDAVDIPKYKCNSCHYFESKRKNSLIKHIRLHQKTSGNVLKCEQSFYECNHPSLLRSHMHVHKDPSELDTYEGTQSNFKTKHKGSLREHFIETLPHKNTADIKRYKCNSCDFETERLSALTRHIRRYHVGFTI